MADAPRYQSSFELHRPDVSSRHDVRKRRRHGCVFHERHRGVHTGQLTVSSLAAGRVWAKAIPVGPPWRWGRTEDVSKQFDRVDNVLTLMQFSSSRDNRSEHSSQSFARRQANCVRAELMCVHTHSVLMVCDELTLEVSSRHAEVVFRAY